MSLGQSNCIMCNAPFECGIQKGTGHCWCFERPFMAPPFPDKKGCLCAACLTSTSSTCYRLWLSYDGTDFCGFQAQDGLPSIESSLSDALCQLFQTPIVARVAGRTDSGVHAKAQVVGVVVPKRFEAYKLMMALSHLLPKSVRVWRADEMPLGFDARQHAIGKQYLYRIHHALVSSPFTHRWSWHLRRKLDVGSMHQAAQALVGEHDFESFRSAQCGAKHARRYIWRAKIDKMGDEIVFDIRGNAFCHNQIRIMVGTLVEVGQGKRSVDSLGRLLAMKDRTKAGPTAPPHGLSLEDVYYPDDLARAEIPEDARFPRYPVTGATWPF